MKKIVVTSLGYSAVTDDGLAFLNDKLKVVKYKDAFHINYNDQEAWLFDYGVLVTWDMDEDSRKQLCEDIQVYTTEPYVRPSIERYSYVFDEQGVFKIHQDCIYLPNDELLIRLALSHAFAQSAKLEFFEEKAQSVIQDNSYITKEMAKTGKVKLRGRELAKLRGVLFDTTCDISLHFNLLDTPEFFWDYPELEEYYSRLHNYLDFNSRMNILNKKLDTIHELLDMLAAEQNHKHSAFLEIVIIVLIAVDIIVYFI